MFSLTVLRNIVRKQSTSETNDLWLQTNFLTQETERQTLQFLMKKKKNVQLSLQGFELPMRHMASQRLPHCATCTSVNRASELFIVYLRTGGSSVQSHTSLLTEQNDLAVFDYSIVLKAFDSDQLYSILSDCSDLLKSGHTQSGVYSINPDGTGHFSVYCDMRTDGGGWTVFQRRQDGSVDFYRGWDDYKAGFSQLTAEFW